MENITIQEEYTLPSLGQLYATKFDPSVKLRSMTVAEEMKRLTHSEKPYKVMTDIIDACLIEKPPMSVYDMCLGDYQYLLHRLRVVTYGSTYRLSMVCPHCLERFDYEINLDELGVHEYDKDKVDELRFITLPVSNDIIELNFQTPRALDTIELQKKQFKKQFPDSTDDTTLLFNIQSMIASVNSEVMPQPILQNYIRRMQLKDYLYLTNCSDKLNKLIGVDIEIPVTCSSCDKDFKSTFRFTGEFFRPTENE